MICRLLTFLTAGALCACGGAEGMKKDTPIPNVSVKDQAGTLINLADFKLKDWLLVYFYPKADTPGCTKQACSLRDAYVQLEESGVKVVGVSTDSVEEQKAFADKYNLNFTLLADEEKKVVKAFSVPTFPGVGLAKRQAFLFKKGKLVWKDLSASTEEQAADVLAVIKG